MIIKFKFGFFEGDVLFGWKDRHAYRLPQTIKGKSYPLLKVGKYNDLFYINRKLKSTRQLMSKTVVINQEVHLIEDSDVPF